MTITPDTQFLVNAGLAVLGLIIGCLTTWYFLKRQQIKVSISAPAVIVEQKEHVGSQLKILFGEKEIPWLYGVTVRISNSGNTHVPIDRLKIHFFGNCLLLSSRVKESSLPEGAVTLTQEETGYWVEVSTEYLNPREYIVVHCLTREDPSELKVEYRHPNVKLSVRRFDTAIPAVVTDVALSLLAMQLGSRISRRLLKSG